MNLYIYIYVYIYNIYTLWILYIYYIYSVICILVYICYIDLYSMYIVSGTCNTRSMGASTKPRKVAPDWEDTGHESRSSCGSCLGFLAKLETLCRVCAICAVARSFEVWSCYGSCSLPHPGLKDTASHSNGSFDWEMLWYHVVPKWQDVERLAESLPGELRDLHSSAPWNLFMYVSIDLKLIFKSDWFRLALFTVWHCEPNFYCTLYCRTATFAGDFRIEIDCKTRYQPHLRILFKLKRERPGRKWLLPAASLCMILGDPMWSLPSPMASTSPGPRAGYL